MDYWLLFFLACGAVVGVIYLANDFIHKMGKWK